MVSQKCFSLLTLLFLNARIAKRFCADAKKFKGRDLGSTYRMEQLHTPPPCVAKLIVLIIEQREPSFNDGDVLRLHNPYERDLSLR